MRSHILGFFGRLTCDEVIVSSGLPHQSVSPRISELLRDGALRRTGEKRRTRTGKLAHVLERAT